MLFLAIGFCQPVTQVLAKTEVTIDLETLPTSARNEILNAKEREEAPAEKAATVLANIEKYKMAGRGEAWLGSSY